MNLSTSMKAGVRALLAEHNIRLSARDLDGDLAAEQLTALDLPGTHATRLAAQRQVLMVLSDEVGAVKLEPA